MSETQNGSTRLRRLLVTSTLRQFALDYAATKKRLSSGQPRFTRVSPAWCEQMEARVKAQIRACIDSMPSVGRTIE